MQDRGASVLDRLRSKAKAQGIQLQLLLNLFCQEEFLRRIQLSRYCTKLVLKGGFLLYTLSQHETRPTMDADYLLRNHSSNVVEIERMAQEILSTQTGNDFITLEFEGLEAISEHREYRGVRVKMLGIIRNTRTPFCVDLGVGDVVIPRPKIETLPTLLPDFEPLQVYTYSLESTVAEKFDAILSRMQLTGRMKDFYDIYYLAITCDFEGRKMQEALFATLQNRGTDYSRDTLCCMLKIGEDRDFVIRWKAFCRKSLRFELNIEDVLSVIVRFLTPPFHALLTENECLNRWQSEERAWTVG